MDKLNVTVRDDYGNPTIKVIQGTDLTIVDGVLLIFDTDGNCEAAYAPGYWISALPVANT